MAVAHSDWKKRESLSSALIQIAVVAVILAGAVYFIYQRGVRRKAAADHLSAARKVALKGNPTDLQQALAELDALLQLDPGHADAQAMVADLEVDRWLLHRVDGAEQRARGALAAAEAGNSSAEGRYGAHALLLVADGKAQEATRFIEAQRQRGANKARLWQAQARAEQSLRNLAVARVAFARAMEDAWRDPRYAVAYGEALFDEGQVAPAADAFNKALAVNPDHLFARLDLALTQLYRKDGPGEALPLVESVVKELRGRDAELSPGLKARAAAVEAELLRIQGKTSEALAAAERAVAQNPDEYYGLLAKARSAALAKDPRAAESFQAAIARRPSAPLAYFDGAAALQASGDQPEADALLDAYEKAFGGVQVAGPEGKPVAALDRDDRFWLAKGEALRRGGKPDEALAAFDRAIQAQSTNLLRAHLAKATVFLSRGELDRATEALKPITPPDGSGQLGEAYLTLGDVLFAQQSYPEGCQQYAFGLARLRLQHAPPAQLDAVVARVGQQLTAAKQVPLAKQWETEAKEIVGQ